MKDREIVFQFLAGARDFLFSKISELTLGITLFPVHWVLGALSPRVK
jgi:hypothetical protein